MMVRWAGNGRGGRIWSHGYDPSRHAIERARGHLTRRELGNVAFHQHAAGQLPDQPAFDLILTFDALHDMPTPIRRHGPWASGRTSSCR